MAIPVWANPYLFTLTNPYSGSLALNVWSPGGGFMLDEQNCEFIGAVRSTSTNVPQANGSILRRRFLTGVQVRLAIELWESPGEVACADLLATMVDQAEGAFLSLLNAGDNEGRLTYQVPGQSDRFVDDVRLLVYPVHAARPDGPDVVTVTIDTKYPYAEGPETTTAITDGGTQVLNNAGTIEFFPVYQVHDCASGDFTLTNTTTGEQLVFSGFPLTGGDYAEIDSFENTIFKNGDDDDLLRYVDIPNSLFPLLQDGNNTIGIVGANVDVIWHAAFG